MLKIRHVYRFHGFQRRWIQICNCFLAQIQSFRFLSFIDFHSINKTFYFHIFHSYSDSLGANIDPILDIKVSLYVYIFDVDLVVNSSLLGLVHFFFVENPSVILFFRHWKNIWLKMLEFRNQTKQLPYVSIKWLQPINFF